MQQPAVKLVLAALTLQPLFYVFHSMRSSNKNNPLPPKQVSLEQSIVIPPYLPQDYFSFDLK